MKKMKVKKKEKKNYNLYYIVIASIISTMAIDRLITFIGGYPAHWYIIFGVFIVIFSAIIVISNIILGIELFN